MSGDGTGGGPARWSSGDQNSPGMTSSSVAEKAASFSVRYCCHEAASQISARLPAPITASSRSRPAYERRDAGMVMRPCLSGTSSYAPERKTRM